MILLEKEEAYERFQNLQQLLQSKSFDERDWQIHVRTNNVSFASARAVTTELSSQLSQVFGGVFYAVAPYARYSGASWVSLEFAI